MEPAALWAFLPVGYLLSVLVEAPVLLLGLSACHGYRRRLFAGLWLTACTYPVVVLVLPSCLNLAPGRTPYLVVAETFAPAAECALFWAAFGTRAAWGRASMWRDFAAITAANMTSFGVGEILYSRGWHEPIFAFFYGSP